MPRQRAARHAISVALVFAFALTLTTASCISVNVRPIVASPSASASPRVVTDGKGYGLTSADDGQTVSLDADTDIVRLVLEDDVDWKLDFDSSYLRLEQHGPLLARGFNATYWLFRILKAGETKIVGKGASLCPPVPITCQPRNRSFSALLIVGDPPRR